MRQPLENIKLGYYWGKLFLKVPLTRNNLQAHLFAVFVKGPLISHSYI